MTDIIDRILKNEGGYSNNSADVGHVTNFGITQATLSAWLGRSATIDDVKNLSEDTARQIYQANYITKPGFDKLPQPIQDQSVDIGVNSGTGSAVKILQRVINEAGFGPISVDGGLGPATLAAVNNANTQMGVYLNNALVDERINYYKEIVSNNPSQGVFLQGWLNRAETFRLPVPA